MDKNYYLRRTYGNGYQPGEIALKIGKILLRKQLHDLCVKMGANGAKARQPTKE